MNNLKYTLGFVVIILCCNGCSEDLFTQVVEIDIPEHESGISIGADFLKTENDLVRLRASKGIKDVGRLDFIEDASVVLKRGNDVLKTYNYESGNVPGGSYLNENDLELESGIEYVMEVEKSGYRKATSSQVMPEEVEITNVEYVQEGYVEPDGYRTDKVSVTFTDPSESENYYGLQVNYYYIDFDGEERSYKLNIFNDIDPLLEAGFDLNVVFKDEAIDGRSVTFDFSLGDRFTGDNGERLEVELFSTTEDKYLFERSLRIYDESSFNPFVEPVIVHENVIGGHGLFSLSNISTFNVDID